MTSTVPILELKQVDQHFTGTYALKPVDLAFTEGEIHAIVGENGAGKSTMIKILTGAYTRSSGAIFWRGGPVALESPQAAIALGINAVHQGVVLCPHLSVAANMFLGDEWMRSGMLRERAMMARAQTVLDDIGFTISARSQLGALPHGPHRLLP